MPAELGHCWWVENLKHRPNATAWIWLMPVNSYRGNTSRSRLEKNAAPAEASRTDPTVRTGLSVPNRSARHPPRGGTCSSTVAATAGSRITDSDRSAEVAPAVRIGGCLLTAKVGRCCSMGCLRR